MRTTTEADVKVKHALDHARSAAQVLHGAPSDAAAQHGVIIRNDLDALILKAKAIAASPNRSYSSGAMWGLAGVA